MIKDHIVFEGDEGNGSMVHVILTHINRNSKKCATFNIYDPIGALVHTWISEVDNAELNGYYNRGDIIKSGIDKVMELL